ncbi:bifunctional metallophosphatase/5'-nucleotidase [Salisediminibacterium halotolerans]|uniref:2',3'-cyclic-nucleotide 2'-phosphodiesterase / 3'-nucleotidase / 5'-nucleotidase n=1 Tax=Salisediminibacterium halotolerans TaxID=517425 RepID=A0A1H9UAB3_9BACI|nr:5'-nucleotidase C-terminal domain-containing protein [Salisediminibacterium haloalkalitolerans]SES06405.1 5'-nucleotidase/hypothetical protein/2',3'-cyclic-nucleotide 2'-phosphodiesterase / 3'-nucleotidase / 5'-nucleotidase [Salisediminibacterium haloalkalitolerans]
MRFYRTLTGMLTIGLIASATTAAANNGQGQGPPGNGNDAPGNSGDTPNGPDRTVESVKTLDASSFSVSFDKTFPAGLDLERVTDVEAEDDDGNEIDIGETDVEVHDDDRSEITVTHDDLTDESGTLTVGGESSDFNYGSFDMNIFHTNDLHGRVDMYPQMITTLNEARDTYGDGLTLEAGDIFSGTLYFNEFRGQAALSFMNLMDYDAFVPGNHEFDLGDPDEGHPEFAEFVENAEFPVVGANMNFDNDPSLSGLAEGGISYEAENGVIYDGIVEEHDGEEIGIFGLNTEDTENISSPMDVTFSDYAEAAEEMVAQFEDEGINKIVALTHLGYDSDPSVGNDLRLAEQVEGIDVIVGGHSHTEVEPPTLVEENADGDAIEPTVVAQAGEYGQHVGVIDLTFDYSGSVERVDGELLATDEREADPDAADQLEPYTEQIEEVQNEPAGSYVVNELPNPRLGDGSDVSVRANETALGNLITDGQLDAALDTNDEIIMAVQNGGGIRAPIAQGEVTVGELIEVQPFGNRLATLELTGEELYEAFETSVADAPNENGGFLQVSDGTQLTYDSDNEPGERVEAIEVDLNGNGEYEEIARDDEMHTIATNNFTATGGDGYDTFAEAYDEGRGTIVGFTDWEMLRDYMAELGDVDYEVEGRINDLAASDE